MRDVQAIVNTLQCTDVEAARSALALSFEQGLFLAEGSGSGGDVVAGGVRDLLRGSHATRPIEIVHQISSDVERMRSSSRTLLTERQQKLLDEVLNEWMRKFGSRIQRLLDEKYERIVG